MLFRIIRRPPRYSERFGEWPLFGRLLDTVQWIVSKEIERDRKILEIIVKILKIILKIIENHIEKYSNSEPHMLKETELFRAPELAGFSSKRVHRQMCADFKNFKNFKLAASKSKEALKIEKV